MLGEVWQQGTDVESTYTGETDPSVFNLQYYRDKARQFQDSLNQIDATRASLENLLYLSAVALPDDVAADLKDQLDQYESKKWLLKSTAEAINLGAAAINAAGGRFPNLSVPSGLGAAPLILPATTIAALTVASGLVIWGAQWISGVNDRLKRAQLLEGLDPATLSAVSKAQLEADSALAATQESPLMSIARIIKWGGIALLGYFAYRAFSEHQRGK